MSQYRQNYFQEEVGDDSPWLCSDLALVIYLVLTIIYCFWSA